MTREAINIVAGLTIILGVALFKLWLIWTWTKDLYARHGARYEFWDIFRMMFGPQSEQTVDKALWNDLEPIQSRNQISNLILCGVGFLLVVGMLSINRMMR